MDDVEEYDSRCPNIMFEQLGSSILPRYGYTNCGESVVLAPKL